MGNCLSKQLKEQQEQQQQQEILDPIIYKDIEGYEGKYSINQFGQVINNKSQKILSQTLGKTGYYLISLQDQNCQWKKYKLHRLVAKYFIENPLNLNIVDHKNNDRTDNRIENLRWCTREQNQMNKKKQIEKTSSQFKGVSFNKKQQKYEAYIGINNKQIHIGLFTKEIDAAIAYNKQAEILFKEFALLNIISEQQ